MLSGALSGSDVFIRVKTASDWLTVGGQLAHTSTESNSPIDVTCKQNGHTFRDLLEDKGLKTFDVSAQMIFSTDEAFDYVKSAFVGKTIELFQVVKGGLETDVTEFNAMVTAFNEDAPDNDKTTADVTFTGSSRWFAELSFEGFFASTDGQFFTSTNQPFFVRK
jgi:predicted secreted protein